MTIPDFDAARAQWESETAKQIGSKHARRNRSGIEILPLYGPQDWDGARYMDIRLFLKGASLGDADSMVSLADLIDRNLYMPNDPMRVKWTLLKKAADLGHKGAEKAITKQIEMEEANRQAGIVAGQLFQGILRGLSR